MPKYGMIYTVHPNDKKERIARSIGGFIEQKISENFESRRSSKLTAQISPHEYDIEFIAESKERIKVVVKVALSNWEDAEIGEDALIHDNRRGWIDNAQAEDGRAFERQDFFINRVGVYRRVA